MNAMNVAKEGKKWFVNWDTGEMYMYVCCVYSGSQKIQGLSQPVQLELEKDSTSGAQDASMFHASTIADPKLCQPDLSGLLGGQKRVGRSVQILVHWSPRNWETRSGIGTR